MRPRIIQKLTENIKNFISGRYFRAVSDILLFIIITLAIHYAWRFWSIRLGYSPFGNEMAALEQYFIGELTAQTSWFLDHIFSVSFTVQGNVIWFPDQWGLSVNPSCSGIKQIAQFALLMVLFPGPWKHKAWFIPSGMIVIYLVNVIRLVQLALTIRYLPDHIYIIHHWFLRAMFYVAIFILWLVWTKYYYRGNLETAPYPGDH